MRSVSSSDLPELGSLVNSNMTTNVDKLGLKANTSTKEGKDVGLRKLSTDVIFVVIDTVLVITARGSPVGGYVPQWLHSVHCQPVKEPVRGVFVHRIVDWQGSCPVKENKIVQSYSILMTPLANIQIAMPVLFFNAIIKKMWDVFAKKKELRKSILSLWPFFPQFSFESNTATSDKHKGRRECRNSDYHTTLLLFCSFEKYLKFENSLFLKLQDMTSVQAAPGSVSMSQYTVNPLPAAS